jgi:hypothetical protein
MGIFIFFFNIFIRCYEKLYHSESYDKILKSLKTSIVCLAGKNISALSI